MCGITCKRSSCYYFTTTDTAAAQICTLYGNEPTGGGDLSHLDVDIWMEKGWLSDTSYT